VLPSAATISAAMRALNFFILLCVCLFFARNSFAQSSCDRRITVNVRDLKGEFVPGLEASSFQAKVAGHEASITSEGVFAESNRVILVLDASGSMSSGDEERWNATKNFAEKIVAFAPPTSRLALLIFNTKTIVKLGFDHSSATFSLCRVTNPLLTLVLPNKSSTLASNW
jgi:hypothetical protein